MFVLTEGVEGTNWRPLSDEMLMDDASGCSVTSSRAANNEQIDGDDAASAWSADQLARRFGESESLDIATLAPTGLVLAGRRVTSVTLPEYESPSDVTIVTRSSSSAGATAAMTFVCPEDRSDTEQNAAVAGLLMVSATVATVDGDECSPCRWALMPADPTAG
ncbi:hypothetical protein HQQ80_07760 [Microbacteriaceae bacterium VKM Ac-2855]|nr:hypothetical protein [Microbacteriaceae bacterium VKM Ac-2855]